jgi:hypothetical protein
VNAKIIDSETAEDGSLTLVIEREDGRVVKYFGCTFQNKKTEPNAPQDQVSFELLPTSYTYLDLEDE